MMSIGSVKTTMPSRKAADVPAQPARRVVREATTTTTDNNWQAASVTRSTTTVAPSQAQAVPDFRGQLMVNFALGSAELTEDSMFEIRSFVLGGSSVPLPGVQSENYLNRRVEAVLVE